MKIRVLGFVICCWALMPVFAQTGVLKGIVKDDEKPLAYATVAVKGTSLGALTNEKGIYQISQIPIGTHEIVFTMLGYITLIKKIQVTGTTHTLNVSLTSEPKRLNEVTISGTLKEVSKQNSPVPVEIYTPKFFLKNPTPNLFESLQMVNGVQPTINCNVCNTGDIRINGLDGPYTMVMIDGMPIVSALSTVYGLSGIPNSMIERIEIVKGPSSTLYGSEAVAGLINVITKNAYTAPKFSADVFATTYGEYNADFATRVKLKKASTLFSVNYFNLNTRWDKNKDGFMDVTLQNRVSVFNKWNFNRVNNREASIAVRYFYENRYGGQMNFNQNERGNDSIYGESIYTHRAEIIGKYQLPTTQNLKLMYSYNYHNQNSYYGNSSYNALQQVGFAQLIWNKKIGARHDIVSGLAARINYYDDNTPATFSGDTLNRANKPVLSFLPGVFVQDEISLTAKQTLLLGLRHDYYHQHGNIFSPRMNYRFKPNDDNTFRIGLGNGFRIVNLFTEDHQALTGARTVLIQEALKPEQSWNININYTRFIHLGKGFINIDASTFYTYFSNRIIADYDTDPNAIIYDNLNGYAVSRGMSMNADAQFVFPLRINAGITLMDVFKQEPNSDGNMERVQQIHAPRISGTYQASYTVSKWNVLVDYTAQYFGPMRLPILPNDFRPAYSPWFSIHNVQFTKKFTSGLQLYAGVKNLFNFIPLNPIMRPFDPFDKTANDVVANPNGYTFDPSYNYAPLLGVRAFFGVRFMWN